MGSICLDYMKGYMRPAVKNYLQKNLANKALLLVDNAPGHSEDELGACSNIAIKYFLPPPPTPRRCCNLWPPIHPLHSILC